jgi:pilus assembly protein CpaF
MPAITIRDLLWATLRIDRIAFSWARSEGVRLLIQGLNTHAGTLSTIHANAADKALRRFTWCVLLSGIDVPYPAIGHGIAEGLQLLDR